MKIKKSKKDPKKIGNYLNMPFQMLVFVALGVFGGIKLDKLLNVSYPVFTILLSLIAVSLAIYYFIKDFLK